jgi:hypothetical protein
MEVTPEFRNAEGETVLTESGRVRVVRHLQKQKTESGISANFDGVSNVTDDNFEHPAKTESPRVQTEEGTVKEVRLTQSENA